MDPKKSCHLTDDDLCECYVYNSYITIGDMRSKNWREQSEKMRTDGAAPGYASMEMRSGGRVIFHSDRAICVGEQGRLSVAEGITTARPLERENYTSVLS